MTHTKRDESGSVNSALVRWKRAAVDVTIDMENPQTGIQTLLKEVTFKEVIDESCKRMHVLILLALMELVHILNTGQGHEKILKHFCMNI